MKSRAKAIYTYHVRVFETQIETCRILLHHNVRVRWGYPTCWRAVGLSWAGTWLDCSLLIRESFLDMEVSEAA
jgi:hypothetical protein